MSNLGAKLGGLHSSEVAWTLAVSISVYLDPRMVRSGGGRVGGRQVRNRVYAVYSVALRGGGARFWGWGEALIGLLVSTTVEKTRHRLWRENVWPGRGFSGILRFLQNHLMDFSSSSQVCDTGYNFFQASSSSCSTEFPRLVRVWMTTADLWLRDCKATGGWLEQVVP